MFTEVSHDVDADDPTRTYRGTPGADSTRRDDYPEDVMGLGTHIRGWGERTQERARRNAMVATNELLARRQEREDVDEFLGRVHAGRRAAARLPAAAQG